MSAPPRAAAAMCAAACCLALVACAGLNTQRLQNADAHYRMATASLQQPGGIQNEVNRRAAYPELTLAIKLDSGNAQYRQLLGALYFYGQDFASAERETLLALEMDPQLAEAHNNLGLVYMAQGRMSEAAAQFRKALENLSYPTPEYAAFNLGNAEYRLGNFVEAVEAYKRSLAILPNNFDGQLGLGMSYTRLGLLAEAAKTYAEAVRLRPDAARPRYELGMTLFKLGRKDEAAVQFRRVAELEPSGELGEQSRIYLRLLK